MKRQPADSKDPVQQPLLTAWEIHALLTAGRRLGQQAVSAPVVSGRHGGVPSRRLGSGLDFAEHRRYQPGDDPRRMDWRVTARIGQPHVRHFHEDLVADCVLLVDRRAPMRFATRGRLKVTQAVRLALLLAAVYAARQARISVLSLDTALHGHGPFAASQLAGLGRQLAAPCPPLGAAGPPLAQALARLAHESAGGSRLLLLSDFADAADVGDALWHRLGRQHRVQAFAIADPAERQLPATAQASLCWPGQGQGNCRPLDDALRRQVAHDARHRSEQLRLTLQRAGIGLSHVHTTDETPAELLKGLRP